MTPIQHKTLTFISQFITDKGYSPSYDEIARHLDIKSKSGVHRLVVALEEQHQITRRRDRARSIEVVGGPRAVDSGRAQMAAMLAKRLEGEHGFDDGEEMMIACTPAECLRTLLAALS